MWIPKTWGSHLSLRIRHSWTISRNAVTMGPGWNVSGMMGIRPGVWGVVLNFVVVNVVVLEDALRAACDTVVEAVQGRSHIRACQIWCSYFDSTD